MEKLLREETLGDRTLSERLSTLLSQLGDSPSPREKILIRLLFMKLDRKYKQVWISVILSHHNKFLRSLLTVSCDIKLLTLCQFTYINYSYSIHLFSFPFFPQEFFLILFLLLKRKLIRLEKLGEIHRRVSKFHHLHSLSYPYPPFTSSSKRTHDKCYPHRNPMSMKGNVHSHAYFQKTSQGAFKTVKDTGFSS